MRSGRRAESGPYGAYLRRGIGTEMIRQLKASCRRRNVLKIWVGTDADNVASRALYESTGARCACESYAEYTYEDL